MKQWNFLLSLLVFSLLTSSMRAFAHGTKINYRKTETLEIQAVYDNGQPIAKAQVAVYAPDNSTTVWITGITDEQGRFTFIPDSQQLGNWEVKVHYSGHGNLIKIPVGEETLPFTAQTKSDSRYQEVHRAGWLSTNNIGYTPIQKLVMMSVGVWGFIGTALFFSRKKIEN